MHLSRLSQKIHVSWIIAFACAGIVAGVVMASLLPVGLFVSSAWVMAGVILVFITCMNRRAVLIPMAVIGGICIGAWRGGVAQYELMPYRPLFGTAITIRGIVAEDTDLNAKGRLVLRLKGASVAGTRLPGIIWLAATDPRTEIQRSDIVTVTGTLRQGFGSFAASLNQAKIEKIQRPVPGDVAIRVRNQFGDATRRAIDEPEASLGLGYLVGQRRGLPPDLDDALVAAGLTHIVVASGYNLTILVRLARKLFENRSKYLAFVASTSLIVGFIAVTGMSPSMSRAGLVAGLSLLAWYYGRRFHPLVLLPFAMAITVLVRPAYAWGDLGWSLSFAAFSGVMLLAPLIHAYFFGDKPERQLRRIMIETVAAQIATLPILLVAFGQFSIVAPVANLLVLPFVPLAMLLTLLAGMAGWLMPDFAHIAGVPAQVLLEYMTMTARFFGDIPWALQETKMTALVAVASYVCMVFAALYAWKATGYDFRRGSLIE